MNILNADEGLPPDKSLCISHSFFKMNGLHRLLEADIELFTPLYLFYLTDKFGCGSL